MQFKSFVYCL